MPAYNTKQRKILLEYLTAHRDMQLSAGQIAKDLKEQGISLSAVYRNLAALEEDGKVAPVRKGNCRQVLYRFVADSHCHEHLHLFCKKCGKTYHMDSAETDIFVNIIAKNDNFSIDKSDTVLYGLCKVCQE